jgi:hypothetical protein
MSNHSPACPTSPSDSKSSVHSIKSHPSILSDPIADGTAEKFNKEMEAKIARAEEEDEESENTSEENGNLEVERSKTGGTEEGRARRTEGPRDRPREVKPTGIPSTIKLTQRRLSLKKAIFMLPIPDSLTDKEDAKIYLRMEDAAVKPLTTIFKTTNRHAFVQAVQKKMSEIGADGMGDLWKCKRKKDRKSFSILTQYNALTLSDVKRSQRNRISLNDHKLDSYSRWIFACLDDSITDTVRDSLAKYIKDIKNDGPTYLLILLSTSSTQHKCKLEVAKRQIRDFHPESYSWDMEKIHLALSRIIGDYESCGVFAVDEENFGYTLLSKLTQSPSEAFNTKVAIRQESLRNKGETIYDILSQLGEDYRELVRQGIWNPDPQEGADIESHELHALRDSHKLLIKKMKGQKRKVRAFLGKPSTIVTKVISKKEHQSKWMYVPPNTAGEIKKSEKG